METEEERFHKRYSVNRAARLGEGRYGRVYRAIDRETEQEVAIKECQIEVTKRNRCITNGDS